MGQTYAEILDTSELSLLDTVDHVLNRGLVISGHITISVADIDLIYLGLNVVLGSMDTIDRALRSRQDQKISSGAGDHVQWDGSRREDV